MFRTKNVGAVDRDSFDVVTITAASSRSMPQSKPQPSEPVTTNRDPIGRNPFVRAVLSPCIYGTNSALVVTTPYSSVRAQRTGLVNPTTFDGGTVDLVLHNRQISSCEFQADIHIRDRRQYELHTFDVRHPCGRA
jgi:hypothetical protein